MNSGRRRLGSCRSFVVVAAFGLLLSMAPGAFAKNEQQQAHRQCRSIVQNLNKDLPMVEVTDADKPGVVKRAAWPNRASPGQRQRVGN